MESSISQINELLVKVFDDILKIEEVTLRNGPFTDVSVTEVHTIDAIGMYEKRTASEVAKTLNITAGTLTVAVNNLVKKGYVERFGDTEDRRIVKLGLTNRGRLLYRAHAQFHLRMVRASINGLAEAESEMLLKAFQGLHTFLDEFYQAEAAQPRRKRR